MKIQEIKINGVVYVPAESYACMDCAFNTSNCQILEKCCNNGCLCNLFDGHALKIKED